MLLSVVLIVDITYWKGQLCDKKRVSISENDDNYLHDISSIAKEHWGGNVDCEE